MTSEIEKQFDCKGVDAGALKLLGYLCIILAPLTFWMSLQEGSASDGLFMIGKGFFAYIPAPMVPWVMRLLSVLMLWIAYAMIKGGSDQKKFGGRIAFTSAGLIYEAGKPDGIDRTIPYNSISKIKLVEKGRKSALYFFDNVGQRRFIPASCMRSKEEFDAMAAMLQEKVNGTQAVHA